jgi:hypothetical protein
MSETVLTANSTIGAWLDHPAGGTLVRGLLAASGADDSVLAPLRSLPLVSLVDMSQGAMPRSVVDDLVRQVNGGVIPEAAESGWQEKITDGRFSGKTVIVTGAGSGIGKAVASRLAREGARVVAVDIAADRLAAVLPELGPEAVTVTADLSKPDDIAAIVAAAGEHIDCLANIAGINDDTSPLHEVSDQMWSRVLGVNLDGGGRPSRQCLRCCVHGEQARRRGAHPVGGLHVRPEGHPGQRCRAGWRGHRHPDGRGALGVRNRSRHAVHRPHPGDRDGRAAGGVDHVPSVRRRCEHQRRRPAV